MILQNTGGYDLGYDVGGSERAYRITEGIEQG